MEQVYDNGIREITVLGVPLKININTANFVEKFANLLDGVGGIEKEYDNGKKELDAKYQGRKVVDGEEVDTEQIIEYSRLNVSSIQKYIDKINSVLCKDAVKKIFHENYEIDEDFIPDEYSLTDALFDAVPQIEKLTGERIEANRRRFNPNRRGKHTKTKQELLSEYRERK